MVEFHSFVLSVLTRGGVSFLTLPNSHTLLCHSDNSVFFTIFAQPSQEILLVLDGTTGLNMLPQAREFNEVILLCR